MNSDSICPEEIVTLEHINIMTEKNGRCVDDLMVRLNNLYNRLHRDSSFAIPVQSDDKKKVGHLEKIYNAESLTYGKIVMCHSCLDQLEKLLNVEE